MSEDSFHLGVKALICNHEGRILLLQVNPTQLHGEHKNYWDLPGGRVQKGQTILDTLTREVLEETGITGIETTKEIGMMLSNIRTPIRENDTVGLILGVYECRLSSLENITLSNEHIAYDWFSPQEAARLLRIKYPEHFCKTVANL